MSDAQAKLTDYFAAKKGRSSRPASKFRKTELTVLERPSLKSDTVTHHSPVKPKSSSLTGIQKATSPIGLPKPATIPPVTVKQTPVIQPPSPLTNVISEPSVHEPEYVRTVCDYTSANSSPELPRKICSEKLKEKLAHCDAEELKKKLAAFKATVKSKSENLTSTVVAASSEQDSEGLELTPAYERYHTLAQPGVPTLSLPYAYKLLNEQFGASDTVVSMLDKRSEVCTFSKLKAAVEKMVRRTFEQKHLGQIKTIFPTAYTFRQEKGLPGQRSSYELTIEANLEPDENNEKVVIGRPKFTADRLLQRKQIFGTNLLSIVKQHHKKFLAGLNPPITVPDDKLTRWHPRFPVDQVPAIAVASLPEAPDTKKFNSAEDILRDTKLRLDSRVQNALAALAVNSPSPSPSPSVSSAATVSSAGTPSASPASAVSAVKPAAKSTSGIPQALLDKVRAKEAAKMQASLMTSKEDVMKKEMFGRVPEIARILRTYFVTQRKPSILLEDVVLNVSKSIGSSLSPVEVEKHLRLMLDTFPTWISLVEVRKGQYVKINVSADIAGIVSEALKLAA